LYDGVLDAWESMTFNLLDPIQQPEASTMTLCVPFDIVYACMGVPYTDPLIDVHDEKFIYQSQVSVAISLLEMKW
jgi:hypothetical protein